ncbi:MAG: hypothetical protein ACXVFN_10465 [Solirubrobacteraceae bacterium]
MLFDLRGRGRRRTVQVIYVSLALLMGGGLVLFGIGGATSGGLVDAINGGSGKTSADSVYKKQLKTYEQRARANPNDAANWASLARLHFQQAGTGENYNATAGAYTQKGLGELRQASAAWKHHLAVAGDKPDPNTASLMTQGYQALKDYPDAVQSLEIFLTNQKPTAQLYGQLAILAAAAKQTRKSTLAEQKAVDLTPKAKRKDFKAQIELGKSQLTATPSATPSSG